jgi:peptide/nickel transport system permease protein
MRWGMSMVVPLLVLATIGTWLSPHTSTSSDYVFGIASGGNLPAGPSAHHWLGVDRLFRDQFARLAEGASLSLSIGVGASLLSVSLGALVGILLGYFDSTRLRRLLGFAPARFGLLLVDVGLSMPFLLLVMAISTLVNQTSPPLIVGILGITSWLGTARLVRAETMRIAALDFVAAARSLGQPTAKILWLHVLPNLMDLLIMTAAFSVAQMILAESTLAYLGASVAPPTPTWGHMLYEGQEVMSTAPWLVWGPGILIVMSVLGFNLLGEGVREGLDARS